MKGWLLPRAVMLVRSWTRAYTWGMDSDARRRRCAEIESDLWESLYDSEDTGARGMQILGRLVRGMRADVSWRLERSLAGGGLMWKKLALACVAAFAAIAALWSLSSLSEPVPLPNLPSKPIPNYVERRKGPPPPPRPGPSWEEFVAKVNGKPLPKPRM